MTLPDDIECRPKTARLVVAIASFVGALLALIFVLSPVGFELYREWVIWTR